MKLKPPMMICTVNSWSQFYVSHGFYIAVALRQSSLVESSATEILSLCDRGDKRLIASLMCLVQGACRNNIQNTVFVK